MKVPFALTPQQRPTVTLFAGQTAKLLFNLPKPYAQLAVKIADNGNDRNKIHDVAEKIQKKLKQGGCDVYWYTIATDGTNPAKDSLNFVTNILDYLGSAMLVFCCFMIFNMVSSQLSLQVRHIGILKTIGASQLQLVCIYAAFVSLFGIVSFLIAAPLSVVFTNLISFALAQQYNAEVHGIHFPTQAIQMQFIACFTVPLLAGTIPIYRGSKVSVCEALNSYGIGGTFSTNGVLNKLTLRLSFVSRPILLSVRNCLRRTIRFTLTVSALAVAGTVFIVALTVWQYALAAVDVGFQAVGYDAQINLTSNYRHERVAGILAGVQGLTATEYWSSGSGKIYTDVRKKSRDSISVQIAAVPYNSVMIKPTISAGRWLSAGDENAVVISSSIADKYPEVKVGTAIVIDENGTRNNWKIIGINKGLGDMVVYVPYGYYSRIRDKVGYTQSVLIKTQTREFDESQKIAQVIEAKLKQDGVKVANIHSFHDSVENVKSSFKPIFITIIIGACGKQIRNICLFEGIAVCLFAWIIAFAASVVLSWSLCAMISSFMMPVQYIFPYKGALLWLVISVFFGAIATILPAKRAASVSLIETLKYE